MSNHFKIIAKSKMASGSKKSEMTTLILEALSNTTNLCTPRSALPTGATQALDRFALMASLADDDASKQLCGLQRTDTGSLITKKLTIARHADALRIFQTAEVIFIGDIHGATKFQALLYRAELLSYLGDAKTLHLDFVPTPKRVIYMGDFLDRGPDTEILEKLNRQFSIAPTCAGVIGNHEVERLKENWAACSYTDSTGTTLYFTKEALQEQTKTIARLILGDRLKAAIVESDHLVTHAAFNPISLRETLQELLDSKGDIEIANEKQLLDLIAEQENARLKKLADLYLKLHDETVLVGTRIKLIPEHTDLCFHPQFNAGHDRSNPATTFGGHYWSDAKTTMRTTEYLLKKHLMDKVTKYPCRLSFLIDHIPLIKQICGHTTTTTHLHHTKHFVGPVSYRNGTLLLTDAELASENETPSILIKGHDGAFYAIIFTPDAIDTIAVRLTKKP